MDEAAVGGGAAAEARGLGDNGGGQRRHNAQAAQKFAEQRGGAPQCQRRLPPWTRRPSAAVPPPMRAISATTSAGSGARSPRLPIIWRSCAAVRAWTRADVQPGACTTYRSASAVMVQRSRAAILSRRKIARSIAWKSIDG